MTQAAGRWRRVAEPALFFAPALLLLLIWRFIPLGYNIFLSFNSWPLIRRAAPTWVGLRNYVHLFTDERFLNSLWVTIVFTVAATSIELVLGMLFALAFEREFRGKGLLRSILLTPMIITPAVVGIIWYIIYHPTAGPLNALLSLVGLPRISWLQSTGTALLSVVIADVWNWTPFMFLLTLSALQSIPREIYEAAHVDGAAGVRLFKSVTLPLLSGPLMVAVILRSMDNFRIFDKIFVLTGGGPGRSTETLNVLIYKTAFGSFELGYAAAIVTVFLILMAIPYGLNMRFTRFEQR